MKKSTFLFVLFFNFFLVQSQVDIGTPNLGISAILELDSDCKELLVSRKIAAARKGISSLVNGLVVFEMYKNSIYYYNANDSVEYEGAEVKDNYKLVKIAADLADELVSGVGSEYLLASNDIYAINGTIKFNFLLQNANV